MARVKKRVARVGGVFPIETKKRLSVEERRIVARVGEIKALLADFGLDLAGYTGRTKEEGYQSPEHPGWESITAYLPDPRKQFAVGQAGAGYWGEPVAFNRYEWEWLEPLLKELQIHRSRG